MNSYVSEIAPPNILFDISNMMMTKKANMSPSLKVHVQFSLGVLGQIMAFIPESKDLQKDFTLFRSAEIIVRLMLKLDRCEKIIRCIDHVYSGMLKNIF